MQEDDRCFVKTWYHDMPTIPSHYCRSRSFAKNKKYVKPGITILQLYEEYSTTAQEARVRVVGSPDNIKYQ